MSTLLLIGGTGFFGKSFLDSFQRGQLEKWGIKRVIAMSRHADRLRLEAPELLDGRVELFNADMGITDWLPYADYVIHAAASTDARDYLARPTLERQNILSAVYNYCRLAEKYHFNSKIVYVSSGAVYGSQPTNIDFIDESYQTTSTAGIPVGKLDYTFAKRDAELVFKNLAEKGLNVSIARCFAFVGRWLPREQHFAMGNFLGDGEKKRPVIIKASSTVYRSYMYADDLVEWLMTIGINADKKCSTYNVGSDEAIDLFEVAHLIASICDVPVLSSSQDGSIDRYVPCINKAKNELGLFLRTYLKDAIRMSLENP